MFKLIDIDKFLSKALEYFESDTETMAASIITPTQSAHAKLIDDKKKYEGIQNGILHDDIFHFILGEIYDIGRDIDMSTDDGLSAKMEIIYNTIKNGPSNFINIRYGIQKDLHFFAAITIPFFITKREYDCLVELNEKLKKTGMAIHVMMINYNPVTLDYEYKEDTRNFYHPIAFRYNLDLALKFIRENGRIVDYDLPFGGETIIEVSPQEEKKIS